MSYEKILLTTDGSERSEAAVDQAVKLARKFDAEPHILYVVDIGVNSSYGSVTDLMSRLESVGNFEKIGEKATESIQKQVEEKGLTPKVAIKRGVPHRKILDYAEEEDIDIIVMSTHGRSGLDRMLLGSVTEKVIRSSKIPVLTVSHEE